MNRPLTMPFGLKALDPKETMAEKLHRLQQESIAKIGERIIKKNCRPEDNFVSAQALALARQPYVSQDPEGNGPGSVATGFPAQDGEGPASPHDTPSGPENQPSGVDGGPSRGRGNGGGRASKVETSDEDSIVALKDGNGIRKGVSAAVAGDGDGPEPGLVGWDGNFQQPPIWDERPQFNKNCPENQGGLRIWNREPLDMSLFGRLDLGRLANLNMVPDGLDLVDVTTTVNKTNAARYGYQDEDSTLAINHIGMTITQAELTADPCKLDLRDPENALRKDECVNDLVRNWQGHKKAEQDAAIKSRKAEIHSLRLARKSNTANAGSTMKRPRMNVYLRPARDEDVSQLTNIYNHYATETVHTADLTTVQASDMQLRLVDAANEKLPFLVAVKKNIKRRGASGGEVVVGWASATDCIGSKSSERFTVDLDVFVHPEHRRKGVGRCLLDRLIQSTDRGHNCNVNYQFDCAQEHRHRYMAGGARDLITLKLVVRSFEKAARGNAREVDLPWIKAWLEKEWGFEQQGLIKKSGVKFRR